MAFANMSARIKHNECSYELCVATELYLHHVEDRNLATELGDSCRVQEEVAIV